MVKYTRCPEGIRTNSFLQRLHRVSGRLLIGKEQVDNVTGRVRRLADNCSGLWGIFVFHPFGGGAGFGHPRAPSSLLWWSCFYSDCCRRADHRIKVDDESIYDFCEKSFGISSPSFINLNCLVAQAASSVTHRIFSLWRFSECPALLRE
jgi:tubulin alpha